MAVNREQIEFWNGPRGATWVKEQELKDRALGPFGEAALRTARTQPGESVVDVGCGCGATSLALAEAVGINGKVLGIDVSEPMLARARQRAAGLEQLRFEWADAARYAFPGDATLLYSRFGVMFFDDPRAAMSNLRRALAPAGRVAFVCWRGLEENPWLGIPLAAASKVATPVRPMPPPEAPGPLSLSDPARVHAILEGAGYDEVVLTPFEHPVPLGDGTGLDAAAADAITMGPAGRLLLDATAETLDKARAAVREALAPHARGNDVQLLGAAWVVTAVAA